MEKKICALILARKDSQRIKDKNIKKLNGKPLIFYSLNELRKNKKIHKIFVMTNSLKIKNTVEKFNFSNVIVLNRSKKSATNYAQSEIAINEFISIFPTTYNLIFFIQLTNLFIKKNDIDKSLKIFEKNKLDSMLSVVKSDSFIWKKNINNNYYSPSNYNISKRPLKKIDKKNHYIENGSFYLFKRKGFIAHKNRLFGKIGVYEMPKESVFDIDEITDFKIVKKIIKNRQ